MKLIKLIEPLLNIKIPIISALQVSVIKSSAGVGGTPKVDQLHSKRLQVSVNQHDIFRFDVRVYNVQLRELYQCNQHLSVRLNYVW